MQYKYVTQNDNYFIKIFTFLIILCIRIGGYNDGCGKCHRLDLQHTSTRNKLSVE